MDDLNNTYFRILDLIQTNAVRFEQEEEDWIWEEIELDTFSEIIRFGLMEGVPLSAENCSILLDNEAFNEDREFDIPSFDGMVELANELDSMSTQGYKTVELYRIFQKSFYN